MIQQEEQMVELLASNQVAIDKSFTLESGDEDASAALVWTLAGKQATKEEMRACLDILKGKTSLLSAERQIGMLTLLSRMALSGDPEAYLAEVQRIFKKIMEGKFFETTSRFGTAMIIANVSKTPEEADLLVERAKEIFARMDEKHPVITDDRDMTFAALIALSDREDDELMEDAEQCYQLLGNGYKFTEGRQTMANLLALSPLSPEEKVARVEELRAAFKAHKISMGWTTSLEFATLAMLVFDNRSADEIAADVAELKDAIKQHKGFGDLSIHGATRVLCAAVISMYCHQTEQNVEDISSAIALAVAEAILEWLIVILICVIH